MGCVHRRIVGPTAASNIAPDDPGDRANARSEAVIATLLPQVQPYARALYFKAREHGITINIIDGLRTFEQQDALYAKGRTAPGRKVTNARGGRSMQNFGIAFDIGVFRGRQYLPNSAQYKAVGVIGEELGLEWGGNWKTIVDQSHFQLRPDWAGGLSQRDMLAGLRQRREQGESPWV